MNDDQKREARLRQALSALVDGEAHELEVSQVLAKARGHDEVKARWARYQLVSAALKSRGAAQGGAAIDASPATEAKTLPAAAPLRRGFGWGSFALAASLTLALVMVLRTVGPSPEPEPVLAALTPTPAPFLAVPLRPVALGGGSIRGRRGSDHHAPGLGVFGRAGPWRGPPPADADAAPRGIEFAR